MKITEKLLLDNYTCQSNGVNNVSTINGEQVNWNYREGEQDDGYNCVVESRDDAGEITLEAYRHGTIKLDDDCSDHPALERIQSDIAKIVGNEI